MLLIIPGIIFMVRYAPLYAYLLGRDEGVNAALSASWEGTKPHFVPVLVALLVPTFGFIAGVGLYVLPEFSSAVPEAIMYSLANLLVFGANLMNLAIGLGIYALIEGRHAGLSDVFE